MLHVVWQILVQITQTSGICRQSMVLLPEAVTSSEFTEFLEIDNVEGGDVVRLALEVGFPVTLLPKAKAFHLRARVAHGREAVWATMQVDFVEFHHVCTNNLVGIDEDDL